MYVPACTSVFLSMALNDALLCCVSTDDSFTVTPAPEVFVEVPPMNITFVNIPDFTRDQVRGTNQMNLCGRRLGCLDYRIM